MRNLRWWDEGVGKGANTRISKGYLKSSLGDSFRDSNSATFLKHSTWTMTCRPSRGWSHESATVHKQCSNSMHQPVRCMQNPILKKREIKGRVSLRPVAVPRRAMLLGVTFKLMKQYKKANNQAWSVNGENGWISTPLIPWEIQPKS